MIRGDDGAQMPFRKSALDGVEFHALSSGQRVCYRIQDGWLGKEAVEVRPLPMERIAGTG
jgi:cold shock CspA family protein